MGVGLVAHSCHRSLPMTGMSALSASVLCSILRGHYGETPSEIDFTGEGEAFLQRHFDALRAIMEGCKFLDKRLGRAAVTKAWPSLSKSSREAILLKLQGAHTCAQEGVQYQNR